jgi:hypothetical protein
LEEKAGFSSKFSECFSVLRQYNRIILKVSARPIPLAFQAARNSVNEAQILTPFASKSAKILHAYLTRIKLSGKDS